LYHHHHYQQSSFLITFNTANPHPIIKPWSNTWKPVLEGPQVVSTQIRDNCFSIFKDLEFFSLLGLALAQLTF
jgi:hypothetical protein